MVWSYPDTAASVRALMPESRHGALQGLACFEARQHTAVLEPFPYRLQDQNNPNPHSPNPCVNPRMKFFKAVEAVY
jgi:hypothetical protein